MHLGFVAAEQLFVVVALGREGLELFLVLLQDALESVDLR